MAKLQKIKKAYLIQEEISPKKRRVAISSRPMKVAFIVSDSILRSSIAKLLDYNTTVWGGYYNLLVPSDGESLSDEWLVSLQNYDPDMIIAYGEISTGLIEELQASIQPYYAWAWNRENLKSPAMPGIDHFGNIGIRQILSPLDYTLSHWGQQVSHLRIPKISLDSRYYEYIAVQFGIPSENLYSLYQRHATIESKVFEEDDFGNYLAFLTEFEKRTSSSEVGVSPLLLTQTELSVSCGGLDNEDYGHMKTYPLVVVGDNAISDLCQFWNIRMMSSLGSPQITGLVPYSDLVEQKNISSLAEWFNKNLGDWITHIILVSTSVSEKDLRSIKEQLESYMGERIQCVDVVAKPVITKGILTMQHRAKTDEEVLVSNREFRCSIPESPFTKHGHGGRWVVDVDIYNDGLETNGFIPPKYNGLSALLSGNPDKGNVILNGGYSVRFTNRRLAYRVSCHQEYISFQLVPDDEIFISLLERYGFTHAKRTDKCLYAQEVMRLIGGVQRIVHLKDRRTLAVFDAMAQKWTDEQQAELNKRVKWILENHDANCDDVYKELYLLMDKVLSKRTGKAYTFERIRENFHQVGKKYSKQEEEYLYDLVMGFSRRNILLRGYEIWCPACDSTYWYPTSAIAESMQCTGCLRSIQPPVDTQFSYKLNELIARAIEQGSISVLLTLFFLKNLLPLSPFSSFMFLPGVEVQNSQYVNGIDIDIIASCNGSLVLAECKDLRKSSSANIITDILTQLDKLIEIAKVIGAEVVFLSILASEALDELQMGINDRRQQLGGELAVHLLSGTDLIRGYSIRNLEMEGQIGEKRLLLPDFLPTGRQ